MTYAYLDSPTPVALAHRGGWLADGDGTPTGDAPWTLENTAVAFQNALDLGYRYLETDARATRDGVLVAFHDVTLDRATDRAGAIADLPYAEVARARVGGREPVPRLEDVLGSWPEARFNIDVKDDRAVAPLARVLRRTAAWDRVCVGSFEQSRLELVRRVFDRPVCMSAGPVDVARLRFSSLAAPLRWLARRGVACAQIPLRVRGFPLLSRDLIAVAHRLGMQVHVWTINDPQLMRRLLDAGVDGIVTDNIAGLREVLLARGSWNNTDPGSREDGSRR